MHDVLKCDIIAQLNCYAEFYYREKSMDFYKIFRSGRLITDGAMGTYYREKFGRSSGAPELANLTEPEKIEAVHREYIEAGADIIRTNSFRQTYRRCAAKRPAG